jgi:hypothetical protein
MTTLTNTDINKFDEKLKIYNMNFFSVINGAEELLSETTSIKDATPLNIATTSDATTYSTAQFATFIKKIVNFTIKNYDETAAALNDSNLCFVTKASDGTISANVNNRDNIISTLKVVNVFVDILEAYKYCIDKAENTTFDSGYRSGITIDRIEIVSEKTRFYSGATGSEVITPAAEERNVGYIRPVSVNSVEKKVLFLSIQSFETGMGDASNKNFNYEDFFTKAGTAVLARPTNILENSAKDTASHPTSEKQGYMYQRYDLSDDSPQITTTGLTLTVRNKTLIKLLIRTLYGLDDTFRKQSVNALYYYYKFVQLYSTFIIHVSNVMYNDVKKTSGITLSPFTIETYNMTTNKKTHGVSGIEYRTAANAITDSKTTTVITAGSFPARSGTVTTAATITYSAAGDVTGMNRGKGYLTNPILTLTPTSSTKTAYTTIVPVVYAATTITNDDNITRLENVITEINDTINSLLDELATYSLSQGLIISTTPSDTSANHTKVYANADKKVVINVVKESIYYSLVNFKDKHDIVKDAIIYDKLSKYSYEILSVTDIGNLDFEITIDAVYSREDIVAGKSTPIFKDKSDQIIAKPANKSSGFVVSSPREFLELRMKDTNSYKTDYITTRNNISKLETDINFKSSKVTHQKNLYESQNNKKIFLERQILAYNIIIAVIVLTLVGINVVKVDKEVVRTVSLSCFGVIILLFVIYFISNLTYVETFADYDVSKPLYDLSYTSKVLDVSDSLYNSKKKKRLDAEISKLNAKFINYFEKLIITLPATDNYHFYKEISEIIANDEENKIFTNNSLNYSKNQNDNNINSIKYELENNKLYINTLLISAVIFIGLYNMYINYIKDDKYLTLFVFICIIIFIVILSYYYITANRRVKTVFKSIYWGPEFSKRF